MLFYSYIPFPPFIETQGAERKKLLRLYLDNPSSWKEAVSHTVLSAILHFYRQITYRELLSFTLLTCQDSILVRCC